MNNIKWDVRIGDEIKYFDPLLSYEATGYRPIDEERGLDFKPEWFTKARDTKEKTGKYTKYRKGGKGYKDFWDEEIRRCNHGYTVNGYTITGDHYFFLNYYILPSIDVKRAGSGRDNTFPSFYSKQYEYFHYVDLCEYLGKDVIALKARGVGFSEIAASLGVRPYTTLRNYKVLYSAFYKKHLDNLLEKAWLQLDNLNQNTEGGMRRVRQKHDSQYKKRNSIVSKSGEERGRMSQIEAVVADKPRKLRGDRPSRLLFEEAGSDSCLKTKYIQSTALVTLQGIKIGTRFVWGTGGDEGPALAGLRDMFNNPEGHNGLPYRHNYTESGDYALTGFFIPAFTFVARDGYIDDRGVTNTKKAKEFYIKNRNLLMGDQDAYIKECAEYCFTPEEALALEGDNFFNRDILTNQKSLIEIHKTAPEIKTGTLEYKFINNKHEQDSIDKVIFIPKQTGKVQILEEPVLDDSGNVPENLYIAGIDGIDIGQDDTSDETKNPSDFCVVIKKRMRGLSDPMIVCIYKDRPNRIIEAHRMAKKLLDYYNCKAVIEHTRVSLIQFFRTRKVEHKYLMYRPAVCYSNPNRRPKVAQFGAQVNSKIIEHYLNLISEYIDTYGHNLWFLDLIDEALKYSYENKTNFDIIAAWGMAELGDEEMVNYKIKDSTIKHQTFDIGYYYDSQGIKRFGEIPKNNERIANFKFNHNL